MRDEIKDLLTTIDEAGRGAEHLYLGPAEIRALADEVRRLDHFAYDILAPELKKASEKLAALERKETS